MALGARRTASSRTSVPQMCILCQEEQELTHTGRSLVLCAYIQRYTSITVCLTVTWICLNNSVLENSCYSY